MTAKEKIEKLTNSWYGFALFSSVASLFVNGIGVFSLIGTAVSFIVSVVITFFLGRWLLSKSGFCRMALIVLASLGAVLGTFAAGKLTYGFFTQWSFSLLFHAALATVAVYMDVKSLRVLTDKTVKAYFA